MIDVLQTGETLELHHEELGCFHSQKNTLEIQKVEDSYVFSYQDESFTMSASRIELFREFEIELYANHTSNCSTQETYRIGLFSNRKIKSFTIIDESCAWRGFNNLITMLDLSQ